VDFFGLNTYSVSYIKADANTWPAAGRSVLSGKPVTDAGWEVAPEGMYELLQWVHKRYKPAKIIITENGAACNDWVNLEGKVIDPNRVDYIKRYLIQIHRAIQEGVPVRGYYVWCFCDNFEWAWGLARRFGIVYVDYATQERIPKESAYWYSGVIANNGFAHQNHEGGY
jgi:beta-glucosidase